MLQRIPHDPTCSTLTGRVFDFGAYHARYVALELAYLGWGYQGFASQADTENTIEVLQPSCIEATSYRDCFSSRSRRDGCAAHLTSSAAPLRVHSQTCGKYCKHEL